MPDEVAVWNGLFLGLFDLIVKELEQKSTMNYAGVLAKGVWERISRKNNAAEFPARNGDHN